MRTTLLAHRREYVSEMLCLAAFMCSAAMAATVLQHPASPWQVTMVDAWITRLPMGLAMGLTAIAIIYSPVGQRSGAHMNPAVTITFLRLGKITAIDAAAYIAAQFAGGVAGIAFITALLGGLPADPSVNYVATKPGPAGAGIAFLAELTISAGMMLAILSVSSHPRFNRFTGLCAGALVFVYITVEAPLSGMSMNPARSFGPAILAGAFESVWVYFTAPVAGMLLAAHLFVRRRGAAHVACAKLDHAPNVPCIFCLHHEVSQ